MKLSHHRTVFGETIPLQDGFLLDKKIVFLIRASNIRGLTDNRCTQAKSVFSYDLSIIIAVSPKKKSTIRKRRNVGKKREKKKKKIMRKVRKQASRTMRRTFSTFRIGDM